MPVALCESRFVNNIREVGVGSSDERVHKIICSRSDLVNFCVSYYSAIKSDKARRKCWRDVS